jgi:hypothetical protein
VKQSRRAVAGLSSVVVGVVVAMVALLYERVALAEPRFNSGIVAGVAGTGRESAWQETKFYGALRGDLLFGRSSDRDVGIGPSVEVSTAAFSDVRGTLGALVLLPVTDVFSIGLTPGGYVRSSPQGATWGLAARSFLGIRSYNYTGSYDLAAGLVLGFDKDLGGAHDHALIIAAQVDGFLLALPALLLVEWLSGGR